MVESFEGSRSTAGGGGRALALRTGSTRQSLAVCVVSHGLEGEHTENQTRESVVDCLKIQQARYDRYQEKNAFRQFVIARVINNSFCTMCNRSIRLLTPGLRGDKFEQHITLQRGVKWIPSSLRTYLVFCERIECGRQQEGDASVLGEGSMVSTYYLGYMPFWAA